MIRDPGNTVELKDKSILTAWFPQGFKPHPYAMPLKQFSRSWRCELVILSLLAEY